MNCGISKYVVPVMGFSMEDRYLIELLQESAIIWSNLHRMIFFTKYGEQCKKECAKRCEMLISCKNAYAATELGRQSFHIAAPAVWNNLPDQRYSLFISRGQFQCGLKTNIFQQVYKL